MEGNRKKGEEKGRREYQGKGGRKEKRKREKGKGKEEELMELSFVG